MALALRRPAARTQEVGTPFATSVAGLSAINLILRRPWDGLEVERGARRAAGPTRLGRDPFDAAAATVVHLVLGERRP